MNILTKFFLIRIIFKRYINYDFLALMLKNIKEEYKSGKIKNEKDITTYNYIINNFYNTKLNLIKFNYLYKNYLTNAIYIKHFFKSCLFETYEIRKKKEIRKEYIGLLIIFYKKYYGIIYTEKTLFEFFKGQLISNNPNISSKEIHEQFEYYIIRFGLDRTKAELDKTEESLKNYEKNDNEEPRPKFDNVRHFFHIVDPSPWPFLVTMFVSTTGLSLIASMHYMLNWNWVYIQIVFLIISVFLWFRDITRESVFEGQHTKDVQKNIKLGMALFIISEVMFFFSFFWGFFHVSLAPSIEIGGIWPPAALKLFNPFTIPLLNTIILLLSGCTLTWVHFCLIQKEKMDKSGIKTYIFDLRKKWFFNIAEIRIDYFHREILIIIGFCLTLFLSFFFTSLQFLEYKNAPFSISDSVYGSAFFLMTGFHGFHVIVGTIFIMVCFFFFVKSYITSTNHVSFECAAWYWHFVDVVWLFLYISIYWWGSWI